MLNSKELINKVKSYNKFLNPDTLTKAYDFALKAHVILEISDLRTIKLI